jgi:hypothetical protein
MVNLHSNYDPLDYQTCILQDMLLVYLWVALLTIVLFIVAALYTWIWVNKLLDIQVELVRKVLDAGKTGGTETDDDDEKDEETEE